MPANAQRRAAGDVKDFALADHGKRRTEWAFQSMPVLQTIRKHFIKTQPLAGLRISACLPVTAETANLIILLRDGGSELVLCAANPLQVQDDVAAHLFRDYSISTFAIRDAAEEVYNQHLMAAIEHRPDLTLDDGAMLTRRLHMLHPDVLSNVSGGTEEGVGGSARLRAMTRTAALAYPVIAVHDAVARRLFDNRYGVGQSTLDNVVRATNVLLAGMTVVIAGYGCSGRGIARRACGLGASVIVLEVDPAKAIEAIMDGHRVMSMNEAAELGEIFITCTGSKSVINRDHFSRLRNNTVLCNAGHSAAEIDMECLARTASSRREIRESLEEFKMGDGRRIYVLNAGKNVNLTAEAAPTLVLDVNYAVQALATEYLAKNHSRMEKRVHTVPEEIDRNVARLKLESMAVKIDRLTPEQERYLATWTDGI